MLSRDDIIEEIIDFTSYKRGMQLVKRINVDTFLKPLSQGISRPMLILGSDYKKYVLKNQNIDNNGNTINFNCMFLNELLACQLGIYLGIPIPEPAIAYIDNKFIELDPILRFAYRFTDGYYFASEQLNNVENNILDNIDELRQMGKPYIARSWNAFFNNIINKEDIAKIIAFDLLIGNFDRFGNSGNILVNDTGLGRKIFAIDHGHAFLGPAWGMNKINKMSEMNKLIKDKKTGFVDWYINQFLNINIQNGYLNGLGNIFKALESFIDLTTVKEHPFQDIVHQIEKISEKDLDECLDNIPDDWFVDSVKQVAYYKRFILDQKDVVRDLIQRLVERDAFTHYRGGKLEWKEEKQFGTA